MQRRLALILFHFIATIYAGWAARPILTQGYCHRPAALLGRLAISGRLPVTHKEKCHV